jgi:hypothetical protein
MAEEEATRAHDGSAELGLPRGHGEDPSPHVHAQIVAVEPDPFLGEEDALDVVAHTQTVVVEPDTIQDELDTLEEVAHVQTVDVEPDWLLRGKPTPNPDTPVHLAGTGHEVLMGTNEDKPVNWLLEEMEEGETAGKTASIKGDKGPRVKLQEPGVSHLTMLKERKLLTSFLPPSPTISKAVRTQRSPVVDTGMLAIPETEGSADLPPLHDPPLPPDKAAEPPDKDPPEQI